MPNTEETETKEKAPTEGEKVFEVLPEEEVKKIDSQLEEKQEELQKGKYEKDIQFAEEKEESISRVLGKEVVGRALKFIEEKYVITQKIKEVPGKVVESAKEAVGWEKGVRFKESLKDVPENP